VDLTAIDRAGIDDHAKVVARVIAHGGPVDGMHAVTLSLDEGGVL
jgi:hypothetical protein